PTVRFVNRDANSGSRAAFDQLLAQHRIDPAQIHGYQKTEFTHAAVADFVDSNMAEAAFRLQPAAGQSDLDFLRLLTVHDFFDSRVEALDQEVVKRLFAIMRSDEFREAIMRLPGYIPKDMGQVRTIEDMFRE